MLKNNKKITLYADSGRIGNKRISDIIQSHIDNKNLSAASRSINEYESNIKSQYSVQIDKIKDWRKIVDTIKSNENDIQQYKNELLNGSD